MTALMGHEDDGLRGSCPEYVELLDLDDGLQAYKVVVLYDYDYLTTFFTQAGAHDEEVEQWLERAGRMKLTVNELVLQKLK